MTQRSTKFYSKCRLFILCSALLCILTVMPAFLYAAPAAHSHKHKHSHNPCKFHHQVQMGQGLYEIARLYNVDARTLQQINGISDIHQIKAWDILCIPHTAKNPPPVPTVPSTQAPYPTALPPANVHSTNQSITSAYQQPITISQTNGNVTLIDSNNNVITYGCDCQPTITPTATPIPDTPTFTPTNTYTPTVTPSPSPTPSPLPTETPSPTLTPTDTPTPTATVIPGHWHGEYFKNPSLAGRWDHMEHDAVIDFDWGQGSPSGLPNDRFSVRWTRIEHFEAGVYIFRATADDGVIVRLDDVVVIDEWHEQPVTSYTGTITVTKGLHRIEVNYYEQYGNAEIHVEWEKAEG